MSFDPATNPDGHYHATRALDRLHKAEADMSVVVHGTIACWKEAAHRPLSVDPIPTEMAALREHAQLATTAHEVISQAIKVVRSLVGGRTRT